MNKLPITESLTAEFKSSFNKDVIETLVAFANANGGTVFIGVSDNGKPQGINIEKDSIQNWGNEIKNETEPQIIPEVETLNVGGKDIVALTICEYPVKPVSTRGRYFKRINNLNHLLSAVEIADEHLKTINSSWDFYIDPNHTKLDLSREKIETFANKIRHNKKIGIAQLSDTELLNKMEILRYNKITFGAYLMFVKDYCLFSDVQIARIKNDGTAIASVSLNTDLFEELEEITTFIRKHVIFNYPQTAVHEIVLNMIIHRDYRESSPSVIKIFDDRIEFYNPGRLYDNASIENLFTDDYTSKPRNKLISKSFREIGIMHHHGSGIMRICRSCREHGIREPVFRETLNGFQVILYNERVDIYNVLGGRNDAIKTTIERYQPYNAERKEIPNNDLKPAIEIYKPYSAEHREIQNNDVKPAAETINIEIDAVAKSARNDDVADTIKSADLVKLSETQETIIEEIRTNPDITSQELAQIVGITVRNIKANIAKLKERGLLDRIGARKTGYWKVIDKKGK